VEGGLELDLEGSAGFGLIGRQGWVHLMEKKENKPRLSAGIGSTGCRGEGLIGVEGNLPVRSGNGCLVSMTGGM
jgi:hypothetical protein